MLSKKCDALLEAYGKQEGRAFNFHYQSNGYHPLVCYDGITGDLIKIQLRDGTRYSCTLEAFDFDMQKFMKYVKELNPNAIIMPISAKTGEGMDRLVEWIESERSRYLLFGAD